MIRIINATPRIEEAIDLVKKTGISQEVNFLYNEMNNENSFNEVFEYLLKNTINFEIRHDEYRFVLIIHK